MATLVNQRCFFHAQREAALKCPGCGRFYCRECASEHDGRWLCSSCLGKPQETPTEKRTPGAAIFNVVALAISLAFLWMAFMGMGSMLHSVPTPTHDSMIRPEGPLE